MNHPTTGDVEKSALQLELGTVQLAAGGSARCDDGCTGGASDRRHDDTGAAQRSAGKHVDQGTSLWRCPKPCRTCRGRRRSRTRIHVWLVQAIEEPEHPIVHTSHGEVVITKQQQDPVSKPSVLAPVGAASILALCDAKAKLKPEADPRLHKDPWGAYKPLLPVPL